MRSWSWRYSGSEGSFVGLYLSTMNGTVGDLADFLNEWAPELLAESYDNVGLLVGRRAWAVERILVSLDVTEAVVEEAVRRGCQAIVAHHPVVFTGLKRLTGQSDAARAVELALQHRIALLAAHTNLDAVSDGVSVHLARRLGLEEIRILAPKTHALWTLTLFVPQDAVDRVREVVFEAGGGKVGNYDRCAFATEGEGSFRPLNGAQPRLGAVGHEERVKEIRLEFLVPDHRKSAVQRAFTEAHPYEEVAHYWHAHAGPLQDVGFGAVGSWLEPKSWDEFAQDLKKCLGLTHFRHTDPKGRSIQKVAVCGGSGGDLLEQAVRSGAEVYITADIKYHRYFDVPDSLVLVDVGHAESEQHTVELMVARISEKFRNFAVLGAETRTNPVTTS